MKDIGVRDQQRGRRERGAARRSGRLRPAVMALEGRALLSQLTVTNTDDSGAGSLRRLSPRRMPMAGTTRSSSPPCSTRRRRSP